MVPKNTQARGRHNKEKLNTLNKKMGTSHSTLTRAREAFKDYKRSNVLEARGKEYDTLNERTPSVWTNNN